MLTGAQVKPDWRFAVRYVDVSAGEERIVGMANVSRSSEDGSSHSYTAVIGGLESHRKYGVEVFTVTQHGMQSCGPPPVTVQTGKRTAGLHTADRKGPTMSQHWKPEPEKYSQFYPHHHCFYYLHPLLFDRC